MDKPPILDFDPDPRGIIEPSERFAPDSLPERILFSFFGPALRGLVAREQASEIRRLSVCGIDTPVFGVQRGDHAVAVLQAGVGAPVAAAQLEELIARGGRRFVVCGGAGVLDSGIAQGRLIVPALAVREEGTSYHYLPADAEARPGAAALAGLKAALKARGARFVEGPTWTTDGLFRETRGKIAARRAQGCLSVEMEAAALFSVAKVRKVQLAQLLYSGDDVGGDQWNQRGWDKNLSVQEMMQEICLEAVLEF